MCDFHSERQPYCCRVFLVGGWEMGLIFKDTIAGSFLELGDPGRIALTPLEASEDQQKDGGQVP